MKRLAIIMLTAAFAAAADLPVCCAANVNANGDPGKYIGSYFVPNDDGRPWFGHSLAVYEITDDYISFDYQYEKSGHAVVYTAEKAYFQNEYTAVGKGTVAYGDTPNDTTEVNYTITLNSGSITLNDGFGEISFYINKPGEFTGLKQSDSNSDLFYAMSNGYYITAWYGGECNVTDMENYKTERVSDGYVNSCITDGYTMYYTEDVTRIMERDLKTGSVNYITSADSPYIQDVVDGRYVIYTCYPKETDDPINSVLRVYDKNSGTTSTISEYSIYAGSYGGRIVYYDQSGDYTRLGLYSSDMTGSDKLTISEDCLGAEVCGDCIYYAHAVDDNWNLENFYMVKCGVDGSAPRIVSAVYGKQEEPCFAADISGEYFEYTKVTAEDLLLQTGRVYYGDFIGVNVNGEDLITDTAPVIENGRTLVPLRVIFEALGASVEWNGATKTVTADRNGTSVELTIGSSSMYIGGAEKQIDVPAMIVNGRTLVPVRAVSEAFGCSVDWDGVNRLVTVEDNSYIP